MEYLLMALELAAFLVAWLHYSSLKRRGMVFIPVLLAVVLVSEAVGFLLLKKYVSWVPNGVWYNYMTPLQFLCIFLLFRRNTRSRPWRTAILCFAGLTVLLTLLYAILPHSRQFNTFNFTVEAGCVAVCCLHYLYECMNSNNITAIEKNPLFYFAMGTLLFYLGTLPLRSMYNYLYQHHRALFFGYYELSRILNYIMYGLIIFGILWAKKK
ncbi:hypothetical protein [Chitinophaga barathri]|uniref:Uncharacterized protein n=1 Tax=Chitinophaga barathri TaxID=1647451 RepID=A0A3N4MIT8_9BACT|nr:hypothetical protein [Chitinophaga barathri]RPD39589.1 hypothetical protein EG028_18230 [Chitinophaga barathri]